MLCSNAAFLLASVDKANIHDTHARAISALIDDFGWNGHEIEPLHLLKLQYVYDGARWHRGRWERRAL